MTKIHYNDCGPYCGQTGDTDETHDIRDVNCLKCLELLCSDIRKAYDRLYLKCVPQRNKG